MGFSCEDKDKATIAFMKRSSVEVRQPIAKVTMQLFAILNGQSWLCATGVLLRVQDKHFILSAAHVYDNWDGLIPLNITDGVPGHDIFMIGDVTLRRFQTNHPENRLLDDPIDVSVCDISAAAANRILGGGRFRFLELEEVEPWAELDMRDWFMVFGFPGELNKEKIAPNTLASNACAFATFLYGGERGHIPWRPIDRDVGRMMDYGSATTRNDEGEFAAPPHPRGMSGGGIWRIAENGDDMSGWGEKKLKLIGIQNAVYEPEQVLRGTRILHALGFIYRGHADLRPEFERQFGLDACRRIMA